MIKLFQVLQKDCLKLLMDGIKFTLVNFYFFFYFIDKIGDNVFVPVGNDFGFRNALKNFKNLDKLINYYNSHSELNVTAFYSTPKLFFEMFL